MKMISLVITLAAFCLGASSADAGFLGMPLHLKPVIEQIERDMPTARGNPSREFLNDDVLTGPLLISC